MTELTRRIISSHLDDPAAVPVRLVLQHGNKASPSGIGNAPCVITAVFRQKLSDIQILDTDDPILPDQDRGKLLMMVIPAGTDPFMEPCDLYPLKLITVTALCFSGQRTLLVLQFLQELTKRPRIRDMSKAVGEYGKVSEPEVYADSSPAGQLPRLFAFAKDRDIILPGRGVLDGSTQDPSFASLVMTSLCVSHSLSASDCPS